MKSQHFQDFDAYMSTVRDVDSIMMLENLIRPSWSISQLDLFGIHIQLGREGSGNIVEGQSWSNGYMLYLPLTGICEYSANGTVVDKDSLVILEPGCDFCVRCTTEHDWYSVFIPTHKLARGSNLVTPLSGQEKMTCRVTRPNLQLVDQFWSLMDTVMIAAANYCEFESSPAARCVEAELLKLVSLVVGQRPGGKPNLERRPRLSREEIIRRSKELLEERDGKPVLVGELAAASGVGERTLRTAFNEYFGVGPARYLQLRQLHQVHRVLRAAEPGAVSVKDVLLRHGVYDFGRFASRYHRLFGELPSKTLRTKRGLVKSI